MTPDDLRYQHLTIQQTRTLLPHHRSKGEMPKSLYYKLRNQGHIPMPIEIPGVKPFHLHAHIEAYKNWLEEKLTPKEYEKLHCWERR